MPDPPDSEAWWEQRITEAEWARDYPSVLPAAECDGRAADEFYGREL